MPYQRARVSSKYTPKPEKLLDQVREVLRYHHYAIRTEKAYIRWIVQFIRFNGIRHPRKMGKEEIERFLSHLSMNRNVAAATQSQALNAIVFLYRDVLDMLDSDKLTPAKASKKRRLPTVLNSREVRRLIGSMVGVHRLMTKLMCGSSLRLMEVLRLRAHDLDFDNRQILVRDGKGNKDSSTLFPELLHGQVREHLETAKALHERDLKNGYGGVYLPGALERKYPNAAKAWGWQYLFPSKVCHNTQEATKPAAILFMKAVCKKQ